MTQNIVSLFRVTSQVFIIFCVDVIGVRGFKYHEFCAMPPSDMKTRFPLYRLEVDTKIDGVPWAYRQNHTLTVSVKALYQNFPIKQIFMSVPSMTKATAEIPARKIHLGEWKWDMKASAELTSEVTIVGFPEAEFIVACLRKATPGKTFVEMSSPIVGFSEAEGGMIPVDCSNSTVGIGNGANALRNLWWYSGGFYNVTGQWDPINTVTNAYSVDMIQFEVYISPDPEETSSPTGTYSPPSSPARWVKLVSDKYINLDYIDLHRYLRLNPDAQWILGAGFGGDKFWS